MPKIKIEIKDEVTREFDSSEKAVEYLNFMGIRQSDQELRLIVLQEKYLPEYKFASRIFVVNPENGIFPFTAHSETDITSIENGYALAPNKELAETIVQIRQGKYRPTNEDEGYKFFCIDSISKPYQWRDGFNYVGGEYDIYFFTEPQRATFIASIEKAKGEEAELFMNAEDFIVKDLEPKMCEDCEDAAATKEISIDIRTLGSEFHAGFYCDYCAKEFKQRVSKSFPKGI